MGGVKYVVPVFRWLRRLKLTTFIFQSSRFDLTLKRRGPIGGAAYGTPSKAKKVLFSKVTASRPLIWPLGSCNTISASYGSQFGHVVRLLEVYKILPNPWLAIELPEQVKLFATYC
jgi:hypothetical protein